MPDPWIDRAVVATICLCVLLGAACITLLALSRIDVPPSLIAVTSTAAGTVVGLTARFRRDGNGNGPVAASPPVR